jgi:hypothetical protein
MIYYGRTAGAIASILAIGDSWFWYPKVNNLLNEVAAVVKPDYANILALGYIGATLEQYVNGRHAKEFARELKPGNARYYSIVLISGAGNDVVDWGLCLKTDCSAQTSAAGCIDDAMLEAKMTDLGGWLLAMVSEIHVAFDNIAAKRPDVFVHCYDYPPPNGKGFELPLLPVPLVAAWLKPAMDKAKVPDDYDMRKKIMRILIDTISQTFAEFESEDEQVFVIRSPGALDQDHDWDNELHPNGPGFRKLVRGPWLEKLRSRGYAP